jgi:hypothetical protein
MFHSMHQTAHDSVAVIISLAIAYCHACGLLQWENVHDEVCKEFFAYKFM